MPECPFCKKEIDSLWLFGRAEIRYQFTTDFGTERVEDYPIEGYDQYECPECCSVLFDEEKMDGDAEECALLFLKTGEYNPK